MLSLDYTSTCTTTAITTIAVAGKVEGEKAARNRVVVFGRYSSYHGLHFSPGKAGVSRDESRLSCSLSLTARAGRQTDRQVNRRRSPHNGNDPSYKEESSRSSTIYTPNAEQQVLECE